MIYNKDSVMFSPIMTVVVIIISAAFNFAIYNEAAKIYDAHSYGALEDIALLSIANFVLLVVSVIFFTIHVVRACGTKLIIEADLASKQKAKAEQNLIKEKKDADLVAKQKSETKQNLIKEKKDAENLAHKNNIKQIEEEQKLAEINKQKAIELAKIKAKKFKTEEFKAKKEWEEAEKAKLDAETEKFKAEMAIQTTEQKIAELNSKKYTTEEKKAETERLRAEKESKQIEKEAMEKKMKLAELERQNIAKEFPYTYYLEMFLRKLEEMKEEEYTSEVREKYFQVY